MTARVSSQPERESWQSVAADGIAAPELRKQEGTPIIISTVFRCSTIIQWIYRRQ
jgi:hypothetical protein